VSDILTIALIGRPNVGKSTLFNYLTGSRDALVADFPGLTRDRKYGRAVSGDTAFIVIDTGGFIIDAEGVDKLTGDQAFQAVAEADIVFFLVDGKAGLNVEDEEIAEKLRRLHRRVYLLVNKTDGLNPELSCTEFYSLGIGNPYPISATQGRNIRKLLETLLEDIPENRPPEELSSSATGDTGRAIRIAVIGKPNVGKSTLINRIIGEERLVAFDQPGTTRDTVEIAFSVDSQSYTLIDTAGIRRKSKVINTVEKFSVIKAIKAIEQCHVVILLVDAREGLADQDLVLLSYILDAGRALLIAINKWDGLSSEQRQEIRDTLDRRLTFIDYADIHFISAWHGSGVGHLFESVNQAYQSAMADFKTNKLTDLLIHAVNAHSPPLVRGRRIKLRYAHQGGKNPPIIIIHGNQVDAVPAAYTRYLTNMFRNKLRLSGTPVRVEYKSGDNPFKDRKNILTKRQKTRKKRLMKWVKRRKK